MKFPKAQPKPLSPCDDCLVTVRGDKGPAVRFGNSDLLPEARSYQPDEVAQIIEREGGFNFGFNRIKWEK